MKTLTEGELFVTIATLERKLKCRKKKEYNTIIAKRFAEHLNDLKRHQHVSSIFWNFNMFYILCFMKPHKF